MRKVIPIVFVILGLGLGFILFRGGAAGQAGVAPGVVLGSGFTYQGRLQIDGAPANGSYDLQFGLFNAATGGAQEGSTAVKGDVAVSQGLFSVLPDFGAAAFDGNALSLEVGVREGNSDGGYSSLSPLQPRPLCPTRGSGRQRGLDGRAGPAGGTG